MGGNQFSLHDITQTPPTPSHLSQGNSFIEHSGCPDQCMPKFRGRFRFSHSHYFEVIGQCDIYDSSIMGRQYSLQQRSVC